jgi:sulfur-carrier protein
VAVVTRQLIGVDPGVSRDVDGPLSLSLFRPQVSVAPTLPSIGCIVPLSVNTLFFASYRDLLGTGALEVEIADGATVADLVASLRARGAPFDALPANPAVAVNRVYAFRDEVLGAGDEVAFIPPVAGG